MPLTLRIFLAPPLNLRTMISKSRLRLQRISFASALLLFLITVTKSSLDVTEDEEMGVDKEIFLTRRTRYVIDDIQTTVDTRIADQPTRKNFGPTFEAEKTDNIPVSNRNTRNVADFEAFSFESPSYEQEDLIIGESGTYINQQDPRVQEVDVIGWFE